MSSNNLLIKAKITHEESKNTWYLAETVYFKPEIHGVIRIQKDDIEMQVHYNLNTSKRIVFLDNRAMEMGSIRDFTWNGVQLPVSTIRLINKLIFGPVNCYSFLLDYSYQENESERAIKFRSKNDGQSLFWVYKFIASLTPYVELRELDNITISNSANGPAITMKIDKIVSLNSVVIETGQQFFVGFNETLTDHIHQSTVDTQFDLTRDSKVPISWIKYARQGINYEEVDDLRYGSEFDSTADDCAIHSSNRNESFNFASLSFHEIFLTNLAFRYTNEILFPIKYQHSDKLIMDKIEFDKQIGNFSYDLVITTLRVDRRPENISSDLILQNLQVERKLYNKENESSLEYQLIKTQKSFFYGYTELNYEPEHLVYALNKKCFQDAKMDVLTLRVTPSKKLSPIETYSIVNSVELRENLEKLMCFKLGISYLRIKSVRFQIHSTYLIATVEITERFDFVDLPRKSHRKLDVSGFLTDFYSDIVTCLRLEAMKRNVSKIISCNDISHGCIGITVDQPLPVANENGSNCVLYNNLDKVLYKLVQEPSLRDLKMSYKHLNQTTLSSAELNFDLHLIDSSQNDIHSSIDTDSFNEKVGSKNYFGHYVFFILIVAIICAVIGFAAIFSKLYRRNVQISSSPSISLTVLKDS
uniref:Uncharacterized protein n=2 Tax=Tetranychus urticae TaxID=32264 RepID=T1JV07_TETUR